jgi:hypothetical protein
MSTPTAAATSLQQQDSREALELADAAARKLKIGIESD